MPRRGISKILRTKLSNKAKTLNTRNIHTRRFARRVIFKICNTEITIQEIVDQIRDFEDEISPAGGMDIPYILDAAGKQPLGGGDLVGMTITLIDWTIKFADRPGPGKGSWPGW